MAVLGTTNVTLPVEMADGMFVKAQTGSAVAALSGAEPQKFGTVTVMTLTGHPKAEYVGEGAQKSSSNPVFGAKTVTPHKVQVTVRFNEEVKWADEDHQLGVLQALADEGGVALGRALDLGVFHGLNPLSGTSVASIIAGDRIVSGTTNRVEITTATVGTPDIVVEQVAGLVIADGYVPTGVAFDPTYSWTLATARFADGRKKFPELGFGTDLTTYEGLTATSTDTVSARKETTDTGTKAVVGQWDLLRWGVQRAVPVQMIEYGDPDGQGDLKRLNQLALRIEVVYGWGVMDLDGFGVAEDKVANT